MYKNAIKLAKHPFHFFWFSVIDVTFAGFVFNSVMLSDFYTQVVKSQKFDEKLAENLEMPIF